MDEDVFVRPGAIRGYHIYSTIWEAEPGEILTTTQQRGNVHDRFAVAVKKERLTVRHLPIEISKILLVFHSMRRHYHLRSDRILKAIEFGARRTRNPMRFDFQRPKYTFTRGHVDGEVPPPGYSDALGEWLL